MSAPWRVLARLATSRRALLVLVLVTVDLALPAVVAADHSVIVPTFHLDGAFQNFSGLSRISHGQLPGRDFFPYLGIGPVLSLMPVFLLHGGTLVGSVYAAWFMTVVALELAVAVLALALMKSRSALPGLVVAPWPVLVELARERWPALPLPKVSFLAPDELSILYEPGNSLRPVRAAAPYLLAAVVIGVLGSRRSRRARIVVLGGAAGAVGLLWSIDFGAVSGGLVVMAALLRLLVPRTRSKRDAATLVGAAAIGGLVPGLLVTGGHLWAYVSYNLVDVRGDQFWYFGPWDRQWRIFSLGDLFVDFGVEHVWAGVAVLAAVSLWCIVRRDTSRAVAVYVGWALLLGGGLATIGGHAGGYFGPFRLWAELVAALLPLLMLKEAPFVLVRVFPGGVGKLGRLAERALPWLAAASIFATVALVGAAAYHTVRHAREAYVTLTHDGTHVVSQELGGPIDARFQEQLQLPGLPPGSTIEEYTGLLTALEGPNPRAHVDSVIAALGRQRTALAAYMDSGPSRVVTSAPTFTAWVSWNLSANWWFYRPLFRGYVPTLTSPNTLVWVRSRPVAWGAQRCVVDHAAQRVILPRTDQGLYDLELDYKGPGRNARAFSMMQNNINGADDAYGYVALDPGARQQSLPVWAASPGDLSLRIFSVSADDKPVTRLVGCRARRIEVPPDSRALELYRPVLSPDLNPNDATDDKWTKGVGNDFAGFLLSGRVANQAVFHAGGHITFSDGSTRQIVRIIVNGPYLEVRLEGAPLSPDVAGYPHHFQVDP